LRKEVKQLRMEKDILKKTSVGSSVQHKINEVKCRYIRACRSKYPIKLLCNVLQVCRSVFYNWLEPPARIISEEELNMYRSAWQLFKRSRGSLGSRQFCKNLKLAGFNVGRYRMRSIMHKLKLVVTQRQIYKVTTRRKNSDSGTDNLLNQQFNPAQANLAWAADVTYLRTNQGRMYLAIVMDLYFRRVIDGSISTRMTVDLVERALQMVINIR
jgi:putative transposase